VDRGASAVEQPGEVVVEVGLGDGGLVARGEVLDGHGTGGALVGAPDDRDADAATVGVLQLLAELAATPA
jgi:hypothetical protein